MLDLPDENSIQSDIRSTRTKQKERAPEDFSLPSVPQNKGSQITIFLFAPQSHRVYPDKKRAAHAATSCAALIRGKEGMLLRYLYNKHE